MISDLSEYVWLCDTVPEPKYVVAVMSPQTTQRKLWASAADLRALADKLDSLNGVQRAVETPDIFWSGYDGEPLERWQDELDGGDPYVPYQLDTAKSTGPRWVVYMPTEGDHDWYEDCHMFTTEEEAMRAVREAKNGLIPAVLDDEEAHRG